MQPLGIFEYPREIVGTYYVTDLPESDINGYTCILITVCRFTKMVHFVPCHKEIPEEESTKLLIGNCYKLHGVPKVNVSDIGPKFVGKFWQSFMEKLNTKLNTSIPAQGRRLRICVRIQVPEARCWIRGPLGAQAPTRSDGELSERQVKQVSIHRPRSR